MNREIKNNYFYVYHLMTPSKDPKNKKKLAHKQLYLKQFKTGINCCENGHQTEVKTASLLYILDEVGHSPACLLHVHHSIHDLVAFINNGRNHKSVATHVSPILFHMDFLLPVVDAVVF